jgi:uncharacterized protein YndB with AHSA1/START domain
MSRTDRADDAAGQPVLRLARHFKAPRQAVFRAWTDPQALAAWFGPEGVQTRNVEVDLRPGGAFSLEMHEADGVYPLSGVYRQVVPPERLVFSWVWGHGELEGLETLVTIELRETDGGTELTLTHEGLPSPTAREKHEGGWIGCLDCLVRYLKETAVGPN